MRLALRSYDLTTISGWIKQPLDPGQRPRAFLSTGREVQPPMKATRPARQVFQQGKPGAGLYLDRAAGSHCHRRHPGRLAASRSSSGQGQSAGCRLSEQRAADRHWGSTLFHGQPGLLPDPAKGVGGRSGLSSKSGLPCGGEWFDSDHVTPQHDRRHADQRRAERAGLGMPQAQTWPVLSRRGRRPAGEPSLTGFLSYGFNEIAVFGTHDAAGKMDTGGFKGIKAATIQKPADMAAICDISASNDPPPTLW